ncbi:MAG: HD domain-containing phosphohydrolase [Pseudomonadota bacterium]
MSEERKSTILVVTESGPDTEALRAVIIRLQSNPLMIGSIELGPVLEFLDPPPELIFYEASEPDFDAAAVCRRLQGNLRTRFVPVLFFNAPADSAQEVAAFDAGAQDYLRAPFDEAVVFARLRLHQQLYVQKRQLATLIQTRSKELSAANSELVKRLRAAAEFKDDETGSHIERMARTAQLLARAAGLSDAESELVLMAAPMHDVGKIGIPDRILLKPTPLTPDEWRVMRMHPGIGAGIIGKHDAPILKIARRIALTHHEKWDGTGYPRGLKGEEIPLVGRIVALADVFDALTSERPFKPAWPVDNAVTYIREQTGRHFDPRLAGLFLELMPEILKIRVEHPEKPSMLFDVRSRMSETLI